MLNGYLDTIYEGERLPSSDIPQSTTLKEELEAEAKATRESCARQIVRSIANARDQKDKYNKHFHLLFKKHLAKKELFYDDQKLFEAVLSWTQTLPDFKQSIEFYTGSYLLFEITDLAVTKINAFFSLDEKLIMLINNLQENTYEKFAILKSKETLFPLFYSWLLYQLPNVRQGNIVETFILEVTQKSLQDLTKTKPIHWVQPDSWIEACVKKYVCCCFFPPEKPPKNDKKIVVQPSSSSKKLLT